MVFSVQRSQSCKSNLFQMFLDVTHLSSFKSTFYQLQDQ